MERFEADRAGDDAFRAGGDDAGQIDDAAERLGRHIISPCRWRCGERDSKFAKPRFHCHRCLHASTARRATLAYTRVR